MKDKAVILLSGGLDSAVTLFLAKRLSYECYALSFDYGQRHRKEMHCSRKLAGIAGAKFKTVKVDMPWKGSSLLDKDMQVPRGRSSALIKTGGIPSTYVPARNTVFLSLASSYAEAIGAGDIFIGAHVQDSSGYPDCRLDYLKAFDNVLRLGTKRGIEGRLKLRFPLINKDKGQIIKTGRSMGVPFEFTWSCYSRRKEPCGECDSCVLRAKGFNDARLKDPLYV